MGLSSIKILVPEVKKTEKKPIERDIFWYDSFYGKMRIFKCSRIDFEYREEKYVEKDGKKIPISEISEEKKHHQVLSVFTLRPIPVIFEENQIIKEKSHSFLTDYIDKYQNYNTATIEVINQDDNAFYITIDENDLEDFTYDLHRNNIEWSEV